MRRRCLVWISRFFTLKIWIVSVGFVLIADSAMACANGSEWQQMAAETTDSGEVSIRIANGTVPLNRPFRIEIAACTANGKPLKNFKVNATMPAHQHGMNYRPVLSKSDDGIFVADGLVFHMPGIWRITVSGQVEGEPRGYFLDLNIK